MPSNRDIDKQKVQIYASSILQCAGDDKAKVFDLYGQLEEVLEAYFLNSIIEQTFDDESISVEDREKIARKTFEPFDEGLDDVLAIMASQGDISLLPRISEAYTTMAEDALDAVIVTVVTVVELDDHLRQVIKDKLTADFGRSVILREQIDPKIIGGIIMSAHGKRIDASVSSHLENARVALSTSPTGGER